MAESAVNVARRIDDILSVSQFILVGHYQPRTTGVAPGIEELLYCMSGVDQYHDPCINATIRQSSAPDE